MINFEFLLFSILMAQNFAEFGSLREDYWPAWIFIAVNITFMICELLLYSTIVVRKLDSCTVNAIMALSEFGSAGLAVWGFFMIRHQDYKKHILDLAEARQKYR